MAVYLKKKQTKKRLLFLFYSRKNYLKFFVRGSVFCPLFRFQLFLEWDFITNF